MSDAQFNRRHSDVICGERTDPDDPRWEKYGGLACFRRRGHEGEHIAMARDAGVADGVHWCCRQAIVGAHAEWCPMTVEAIR